MTIRLSTSDDELWLAFERQAACRRVSWDAVAAMISQHKVQVVPTDRNIPTIIRLAALGASVEVVSPLWCPGATPCEELLNLTQVANVPRVLGGWRRLLAAEVAAYKVRQAVATKLPVAVSMLEQHPAYAVLRWAGTDVVTAALLLGLLVDPFRYVNPRDPVSCKRVSAFMGLFLPTVLRVLSHGTETTRTRRCALMMQAWVCTDARLPFCRIVAESVTAGVPARGVLKSSRLLLRLLWGHWLAAVSERPDLRWAPSLLTPEEVRYFDSVVSPGM